jgi:2-polyprenyl-3-methyl-5-hydroxy-6-metoxy-1,4-benzoquinol methylase
MQLKQNKNITMDSKEKRTVGLTANKLFKPKTFEEGIENMVGACNDVTVKERWEKETPVFAQEILKLLPAGGKTVLDYGCGIGRLAKEVLKQNRTVKVIGVDTSTQVIELAKQYIDDSRFVTRDPRKLAEPVDLAYCVYVLQHVPAVEIREILQRIHHCLKKNGIFIVCSSEYRMAMRFDLPLFEDDRRLGVDLRQEISRYFIRSRELFSTKVLETNPIVKRIVTACDGGLVHPALVYKKRVQNGPLFNYE